MVDLTLFVYLIVAWFSVICGYYVILAIASLIPQRNRLANGGKNKAKLLVVIPARNEENVISDLVKDLEAQDYDKDLFRVLVIVDHCDDKTEDAVKGASSGHTTVLVRNEGERGKGATLDYGIAHASDVLPGFTFDSVAVFDADNRIGPGVVSAIARALSSGQQAVQIKVLAKNPDTSSLARVQALESVVLQRVWQLGKDRLGLVSAFAGTGEAIKMDLLKQLGGFRNSLTDDLDLTIRMADRGVRVKYLPDVITYDEKPDSLKVEMRRRVRWSAGHLSSLFKYGPRLITSKPTLLRIDALFYLLAILTPLMLWGSYTISTLSWLGLATFSGMPIWVWIFLSGLWPSLVLIVPYLERQLGLYRAAPALFAFLLVWMIAVPAALVKLARRDSNWSKTPHGIGINISAKEATRGQPVQYH